MYVCMYVCLYVCMYVSGHLYSTLQEHHEGAKCNYPTNLNRCDWRSFGNISWVACSAVTRIVNGRLFQYTWSWSKTS